MTKEELQKRTKTFAHRCVKLACSLPDNTLGKHIRGQLIRSSTSVAANYRAACVAQSKASFTAKLSIVVEEVDETKFWLEFIENENLFSAAKLASLKQEANELTSIFISARRTTQTNKKS
ncbi:MAG: four helix bundle protein [Prevotellaceae bacterium]|jgi:four helix bundle protein|nr:four helix bundle protein [Prevotellaceae bacterium]